MMSEMTPVNERLSKLCIEYDIHAVTESHIGIVEFWDRIPKDKKIGIRGAGRHSVELFQLIRYWEYDVVGFFDDNKQFKELLPYTIYDVSQVGDHDIDIMFLSSYMFRFDMMEEIHLKYPRIQCIDMYDFFRMKNERHFVQGFHDEYVFNEMYQENNRPFHNKDEELLLKIYYARKHLNEIVRGRKWIAYNLKILISCYLKIKDFKNAFEYIEVFVQEKHEGYEKYRKFQVEMERLLSEIRDRITEKKEHNESILFLLIDSFSYSDFQGQKEAEMSYLYELAENQGIIFESAYSPGVYTTEILSAVFSGQKIHSNNFHDLDMTGENNKFVKSLEENAYRIQAFGAYDLYSRRTGSPKRQISELLWQVTCDLYSTDQKTFYFVHETGLIHEPTRCPVQSTLPIEYWDIRGEGYNSETSYELLIQENLRYLDNCIKYYFQFFSGNMTKVIFGDHGHGGRKLNKRWDDKFLHVALIIISNNFRAKRIEKLYSTFFLNDLLLDIICKKPEVTLKSIEFAEVQFDLFRNAQVLKRLRNMTGTLIFIPFKAFVTQEDKYVITYAGQEFYYVMPDEKTNLIDHPDCQERISYIKSKNDLSFPDFKHPIYADTYRFYFDESDRPTQLLED